MTLWQRSAAGRLCSRTDPGLLARYDRILLIPGTTSVAHLEENMASGEVALDEDDLAALESVQQHGRPQR